MSTVSRAIARWSRRILVALTILIVLIVGALAVSRGLVASRETGVPPERVRLYVAVDGENVSTSLGAVFVQRRGPRGGVPVVLIHGAGAWSGFWTDVAEALARSGFHAVAIDLPPFGKSSADQAGRYARRDQAQRIHDVLATLKLERAIIVGHSFGAGPVVETALRHGERLRGMVLVNAALGLPTDGAVPVAPPAALQWLLGQPMLVESIVAATATNPMLTNQLVRAMMHRKDAADDQQVAILRYPLYMKGATAGFSRWLPNLLLTDGGALSAAPDRYRTLRMPTAILWGNRDTVTPLAQGERLQTLIEGSTLTIIDEVGHIPHIEDPKGFLEALRKALDALSVRG